MPHSGTELGPFGTQMTEAAHTLEDTDWHIPELYSFLEDIGASVITARYSRYVIDLNRDPSGVSLYPGQNVTELCPTTTFGEAPIYIEGAAPAAAAVAERVKHFWQPYHDALAAELGRLKSEFGYALLWDAHSIASRVPRFFEGKLPDFNLGTNRGKSCGKGLGEALLACAERFPKYSAVLNGRFKGGFITRQYGQPQEGVHAVQLELSQATYMKEQHPFALREELASDVCLPIQAMIEAMLAWGESLK
jgi:N-formylglutamate amidohydrolase